MSQSAQHDDLASIDTTPDPEPWLRMLRGMWPGDEAKQARYRKLFQRLRLGTRDRVLEVGCGAGGALRFLQETVAGLGLLVGTDPSRLAIGEAIRLSAADGLAGARPPSFLVMDGRRLAFASGAFDAAFCTRTLVHAVEPERIIHEMIRVVRPGGRLLIVEPDRDGMLSSVDADHVNRIFWSERRSLNPRIGRRLYPILREAGLVVEHLEPSFLCSLTPPGHEQIARLEQELSDRSGEWWGLVEAGRITAEDLRTYVRSLRQAQESGSYLRCDLEFAYIARTPC